MNAKVVRGDVGVPLARLQKRRREVRPVDRVREVLCLEAEAVVAAVRHAVTARKAVEVVPCQARGGKWCADERVRRLVGRARVMWRAT